MRTVYLVIGLLFSTHLFSQQVVDRIDKAIALLEKDSQFSHALLSIYIVETKSGKLVYQKNGEVGLAPASCQKIITSASAFELLGKGYRYKTPVKIYKSADSVRLYIEGTGDPTLGSWRWEQTKMETVYKSIRQALSTFNVKALGADVSIMGQRFDAQPVPDGWVWQDIGNYYGAGAWAFNWHENQYDLILSPGRTPGDTTHVQRFDPLTATMPLINYIRTGPKGSGDNAYIYSAPYSSNSFAMGTIPPGETNFSISGSIPDPAMVFTKGLKTALNANEIIIGPGTNVDHILQKKDTKAFQTIYTFYSPSLDSINYWFMKKSVNLFGEAFVKTIAYEKTGIGSTGRGMDIVRDMWSKQGIESSALNIIDGSGLSPANRVTAHALVHVLQYARERPWFDQFYQALPEMNGINMKDGYIGGVRSYAGYVKNRAGISYTFSFIVNNFYGSPGAVREKMWKVLDILK